MREGVGVCGHGMESTLGLWWEGEGLGSPYNGGKRQQSTRCRGSERRLRTREAHGVRQLAGAFRATALRPETHPTRAFHERPNWLLTRLAHSMAGFHPGLNPIAAASRSTGVWLSLGQENGCGQGGVEFFRLLVGARVVPEAPKSLRADGPGPSVVTE